MFRAQISYILLPGAYVAELEGPDGTYLRGSPNCVEIKVVTPRRNQEPLVETVYKEGGVFFPSDRGKGSMLYFYRSFSSSPQLNPSTVNQIANSAAPSSAGASVVGGALGGAIVNAIIRAGEGKIVFPNGVSNDVNLTQQLRLKE